MNMCDNGDGKPAMRGGFCWACVKCLQRNGSTVRRKPHCGTRYESPEDMLTEAVISLSDAADKATAHRRFMMAQLRYRRRRNTVHKSPEDSP
jgi:hypothetical protein